MRRELNINRTTFFCILLLAVLAGIFIARFTTPLNISFLIFGILLLPLIVKKGVLAFVIIVIFGVFLGWWRGGILQIQNSSYNNYFDRTVVMAAQATEDGFYSINSQLEFMADGIVIDGHKLPGKVRVRGFGASAVYRHDIVTIRGKLYPAIGSKQANISFAELEVIKHANSPIDNFRRQFIAGIETALPEPAASFGIGLLIGQRSLLPKDIALILTAAGLTHIVAVSGYNLTIIIRAITRSLKKLSRFQIVFCSLSLIYLFLLITGYSPSIVRAAIVASIGLLAWYFGRNIRPILLILIAAAVTGFYNPYYLWGDIGWYLSFLAFFGVLIVGPLIAQKIYKNNKVPVLSSVAIESFAAQIMTIPIIMLVFGRVSVIGFISNIIIVPIVPFGMLFTTFAGIGGMIIPSISGWFALPARIVLNIILTSARWFSELPGSKVQIKASVISMILLYFIIATVIIGLKRRAQSVILEQKDIAKAKE